MSMERMIKTISNLKLYGVKKQKNEFLAYTEYIKKVNQLEVLIFQQKARTTFLNGVKK